MAPNAALHTYHTEATAPQHAWQSMDTLTAGVPPDSTHRAAFDGAMVGAVPELGPGWVALRNCALGGGGPRVGLVLLHPSVGVALVDVVPKATDAAARLRRALDARRFPAIFGGYPPVARVVLPAERFPDLGRILDAEFEAQPPLALAGGDGWVRTARAALESELPVAAPERLRTKRPRRFRWRPVVLAGGAFAAALVLASALPWRDRGGPVRSAVVAAVAPSAASDLPLPEAAPADRDFTAQDVAAALTSAERAAASTGAPQGAPPAAVVAGGNRPEPAPPASALGLDHRPQHAPPAAVLPGAPEAAPPPPDAGTGTTTATDPQESGGAPTAMDSGEPPPAPMVAAAPTAPAAGSDLSARHAPPLEATPPEAIPAPPVEPRSPPQRAAAATVNPPPRPAAPQTPATAGRRTVSPTAAAPAADPGAPGRCREILVRATMGEALSDNEREFLRRGCQRRG